MFSGVYEGFRDVRDDHPWASEGYRESCRVALGRSKTIHPTAASAHAVLALILNTLPAGRVARVLDWAGGTGLRYWTTRPALNRAVHWHVVDNPALAAISEEVMGASEELVFAEALPPLAGSDFDVVLVYSSLQYVDDQRDLLTCLAGYGPRFIVLPRLMALEDSSYVTCQTIEGLQTPCRVSSIREITQTLKAMQYDPVVVAADGLDLSPLYDDSVAQHLRVGMESLLVFGNAGESAASGK